DQGPHMVPYLRAANVKDGRLDLSDVKEMNFTPGEQNNFALQAGDVLVTEGSGSLSAVGAASVWNDEVQGTVCFQNTLLRLRPKPATDPGFLSWWCRHAFGDGLFASIATGANIFHVSAERVRSLPMAYIELAEQRAIADYLDAETARIDALIAKKQQLIRLLEERIEAAVFSGVTGRLTSAHSKVRASGIDWIGDIPVGYGTPTIGANFSTQLGKMLNAEAAAGDHQHRYIKNTNVQWDRFKLDDLPTMTFDALDRQRCELAAGDLMVCEGGEVGRAATWEGADADVYFQKALHRVRPFLSANSRFLMYCLWAAANLDVFRVEGNQATIVHLTGEQLREHRFPWPPSDEQDEIVKLIDVTRKRLDLLCTTTTRQIELLTERRQALITAAVTGEFAVPGAA
ncbi:restriction endonuclease subunit S, partial [Ilumatobacter sp.]|uniref:restriction endonuclease subunit S n=1 Tax=Ilumatobacter sp. TaxID=1967498 RepID=UPI00375268DF